jgi:5'-3' exonuclease
MIALIDGDILLYRVGFTTEQESEEIAQFRMEELITRILDTVQATSYKVYLSAGRKDTFRAKLNPSYKANRTQPKPLHYNFLKQYLIDVWNAEVAVNEEADDLLGKEQTKYNESFAAQVGNREYPSHDETIICSIDKDLKQIPGHHYNFVRDEFDFVTQEQGLVFFYKQLLIGDTADNIPGVGGIGKAKAGKLLDHFSDDIWSLLDEADIFEVVQNTYRTWLQNEWADQEWSDFQEKQMNNIIHMNGIMLKIRTREEEIWNFPTTFNLKPGTEPILDLSSLKTAQSTDDIETEQIG